MNGNAIVFASSISDISPKDNGILFIGDIGIVYGDVIIENRGNIIVTGSLINNGAINNYNTIEGTGERLGNPLIHIIEMDGVIIKTKNANNEWVDVK